MTPDIVDIERTEENKLEIESICRSCTHFQSTQIVEQQIRDADGNFETYSVQLPTQICTQDGRYVIFQGLKKADTCPEGLW
jgi:hypothetical protein